MLKRTPTKSKSIFNVSKHSRILIYAHENKTWNVMDNREKSSLQTLETWNKALTTPNHQWYVALPRVQSLQGSTTKLEK